MTLQVLIVDDEALAAIAERSMRLQCLIQDGEMLITGGTDSIRVVPELVCGSA